MSRLFLLPDILNRDLSCDALICKAAAVVKPLITGFDIKSRRKPENGHKNIIKYILTLSLYWYIWSLFTSMHQSLILNLSSSSFILYHWIIFHRIVPETIFFLISCTNAQLHSRFYNEFKAKLIKLVPISTIALNKKSWYNKKLSRKHFKVTSASFWKNMNLILQHLF